LWWSYGFSVLNCSQQALDQRVQLLLLSCAERGVEHRRQLGRIGRARLGELLSAGLREGNPTSAAVVGIKFTADQSGRLDPVDKLAGRPDSNAQCASQIPDPQAAVGRSPDEIW